MVSPEHVSQALIIPFKLEVLFVIQDFNVEVLEEEYVLHLFFSLVPAPCESTLAKLSILAFSTVELRGPFSAICLAQRSLTMALNLQSPRIPLQLDLPLPVHQNGVGKSSL